MVASCLTETVNMHFIVMPLTDFEKTHRKSIEEKGLA